MRAFGDYFAKHATHPLFIFSPSLSPALPRRTGHRPSKIKRIRRRFIQLVQASRKLEQMPQLGRLHPISPATIREGVCGEEWIENHPYGLASAGTKAKGKEKKTIEARAEALARDKEQKELDLIMRH